MNNHNQKKYNICGALDKLTKGEKFSFADYFSESDIQVFVNFRDSFKYLGNFTHSSEQRYSLSKNEEYKIEASLLGYNDGIKNEKSFFSLNTSIRKVFLHVSDTVGTHFYKISEVAKEKFFVEKISTGIFTIAKEIEGDLEFCSGNKEVRLNFFLNTASSPFFHQDSQPSSPSDYRFLIRGGIVPFGEHTVYTDLTIEEVNEIESKEDLDDKHIFKAKEQQIAFHLVNNPIFNNQEIEYAVHKSPNIPKASRDYNTFYRLYINFSIDYKNPQGISEHLSIQKENLIEKYNIPPYEFNWANLTLYGLEDSLRVEDL